MGTSSGSGAGAGGSFRPGPPGAHPPAPVQLPPVSSIHAEPTQRGYPSEPSHHYPPHPQQHYVHTPAPSLPSFMSPHGHLAAGLLAQHPLQHGLQPGSAAQGIRSPSAGGHVGIAPAGPAGAAHNIPSKRGPQPGHQGEQPPPKKMGKWTAEEDALAIDLRAKGMKWDDISKRIPGRSPISCRLRYQNYSEKRPDWTEERLNNMAKLYNRHRKEWFDIIAAEINVPWRAVEKQFWRMGLEELCSRAQVNVYQPHEPPTRSQLSQVTSVSGPTASNMGLPHGVSHAPHSVRSRASRSPPGSTSDGSGRTGRARRSSSAASSSRAHSSRRAGTSPRVHPGTSQLQRQAGPQHHHTHLRQPQQYQPLQPHLQTKPHLPSPQDRPNGPDQLSTGGPVLTKMEEDEELESSLVHSGGSQPRRVTEGEPRKRSPSGTREWETFRNREPRDVHGLHPSSGTQRDSNAVRGHFSAEWEGGSNLSIGDQRGSSHPRSGSLSSAGRSRGDIEGEHHESKQ